MTGEHIWSQWMGRLFDGQSFSNYAGPYHVEWGFGPDAKNWTSKSIDSVAKAVCDTCNNGWMSDIDDDASKTMSNMIRHGSAISLLPLGIASIARFAFKAAVVVDCAKHPTTPFFSPTERKRFSEGRHDVPSRTQVWLSTIRTTRLHGRYMGHYAKIKNGRYRNFKVLVFTYTLGFLVIQLAASRWGSRVLNQPQFAPTFRQDDVWRSVCVPLWPSDGRPVVWPTDQYFTDETVDQIAQRWMRVTERRLP
jgi:hypothetical protein